LPVTSDKEGSSGEEFVLLALIDRLHSGGKAARLAIPDFDEHEASGIAHDEIDFTAAATEVSCDEIESARLEVFECQGLCVFSY